MKHIYKYILSSLVLLTPALASAQTVENPPIYDGYHVEGGVATNKSVSKTMDSNGYYTLTLETFATGVSSITQKAIPSDVVLVLDLSTSMGGHRGYCNKIEANTQVSIDDIESDDPTYGIYRDGHGFGYQISVLERNGRYYPYCVYRSYVMFYNQTAHQWSRPSGFTYENLYDGGGTIGNSYAYATNKTTKSFTFYTDNTVLSGSTVYEERICSMKSSRIHELKAAVKAFINEIIINNEYKTVNGTLVRRDTPLGNKIGIVSWAKIYLSAHSTTTMIDATEANKDDLYDLAEGFTLYDGTVPPQGLSKVQGLFDGVQHTGTVGEDFMRTVVFFTDGQPDPEGNPDYDSAIAATHALKIAPYSASVWSVGLFSLATGATEVAPEIQAFMEYASSNYPDATSYTNHGNPKDNSVDPTNYYEDVSTGSADLSQVFKTIAQASGGSEKTIPGATQIVDGVTNSFTIPTPADGSAPTIESAQVRIYTRSINADGDTWTTNPDLTIVPMTTDAEIETPDESKSYMTDEGKVGVAIKNGRLIVMGFNYSKPDSDESTVSGLTGNWVGWRYPNQVKTCAGKELVIEFKIQGDPDATGGDDTQTNTPDSGIFIPTYDEDGHFLGYEPINQYNVPEANIPINIVIKKEGMRHGESATIQIYRAKQSAVYNTATGKLKPNLPNGRDSWENFSKVILTNWGEDGEVVTETLLCLDPTYVYLLEEDNWGWAYELDDKSIDTSEQEKNPFIFTNTEKTDAVKHAEAASLNRFGNELHGRDRQQTVKSSKVESFTTQKVNPDEDVEGE